MTYYFIYMYQSFVKHKNYLGISNVVSWVSCCMLVVFLSQWPGRSCFTFCLSVSFFIHHIWLSYWKRRAENTGPTVLFYKFGNVSKGWSYRFLFQSFTRLGRHCKMNLLKLFFFFFSSGLFILSHSLWPPCFAMCGNYNHQSNFSNTFQT